MVPIDFNKMNQVCVDCNDVYVYIFSEFTCYKNFFVQMSEKQRHYMADKCDRPDQYPHGALLHYHWASLKELLKTWFLLDTESGRSHVYYNIIHVSMDG